MTNPDVSPARASSRLKKILLLFLRIAVSAGLLYLAFRHVNWTILLDSLRDIDPLWFGIAFLCLAVMTVLGGLRWRLILRACGLSLPLWATIRYTFIAAFFNQTLPASVGGDAARIWLVNREHANWKAPLYSIVIDRSFGGIGLALLVLACLPLTFALMPSAAGRLALVLMGVGCLTVFVAVLAVGALPWRWIDHWRATRQARAVTRISAQLFRSSWHGATITVMSVIIHLCSALSVWCIAHALAAPLPLTAALVLVPPVMLIAMAPVSIAGWGVRESAMVALLAYAGIGNSAGFLISVLFGAVSFLVGLIGGGLWIGAGQRLPNENSG